MVTAITHAAAVAAIPISPGRFHRGTQYAQVPTSTAKTECDLLALNIQISP